MKKIHKHRSFGYGSNTNFAELESKLPTDSVKLISRAWCVGYEPVYRYYSSGRSGGALDIKTADTSILTPGALMLLSDEGLSELDRKEGAFKGDSYYDKCPVVVLTEDGDQHLVETYVVNPNRYESSHQPPHSDYRRTVSNGMRSLGHSIQPFEDAADDRPVTSPIKTLFVYGTLKQGELRGDALSQCEIISRAPARAPGRLFNLGKYPGMAKAESDSEWVIGEVITFKKAEETIHLTDKIEGFIGFESDNNLFNRRVIRVSIGNGISDVVWVYLANDVAGAERIPEGFWSSNPSANFTSGVDLYKDNPVGASDEYEWDISQCSIHLGEMKSMLYSLLVGSLSEIDIIAYANQLLHAQRMGDDASCFFGSWRIIPGDDYLPVDARVDFVYTPTYVALAFLCSIKLDYPEAAEQLRDLDTSLKKGSMFAIGRNLSGSGYEGESGALKALIILEQGRVSKAIQNIEGEEVKHLIQLISSTKKHFFDRVCNGDIDTGWGDIAIDEKLMDLFSKYTCIGYSGEE